MPSSFTPNIHVDTVRCSRCVLNFLSLDNNSVLKFTIKNLTLKKQKQEKRIDKKSNRKKLKQYINDENLDQCFMTYGMLETFLDIDNKSMF